jgi:hypothetical protein
MEPVEIFPEVTTHLLPVSFMKPVRPSLSQALVLGYFMICFEKPTIDPVYDPIRGVYGLVIGVRYIWKYQPNYHE